MSSFEKSLSDLNNQVLHKQAAAGFEVEVVDEDLVPTVHVSKGGKSASFPLEKVGLYYSDGDQKFRSLETDDEVRGSDLSDLVIEAFLFSEEK